MRVTREVDFQALAAAIRTKRGETGLRAVAEEIGGISASTLSRVEQGKEPDLDTYMRLCRWLKVSPEHFMTRKMNMKKEANVDKTELFLAHLRADKKLGPGLADAIGQLIKAAHQQFDVLRAESLTAPREAVATVAEPTTIKLQTSSRAKPKNLNGKQETPRRHRRSSVAST